MDKKKKLRIELTDEQKKLIKVETGKDAKAIEFWPAWTWTPAARSRLDDLVGAAAEIERDGAGVLDGRGAMFADQGQEPLDAPDGAEGIVGVEAGSGRGWGAASRSGRAVDGLRGRGASVRVGRYVTHEDGTCG